jgi:hypothetical protein
MSLSSSFSYKLAMFFVFQEVPSTLAFPMDEFGRFYVDVGNAVGRALWVRLHAG